jgi:hypothetical protein
MPSNGDAVVRPPVRTTQMRSAITSWVLRQAQHNVQSGRLFASHRLVKRFASWTLAGAAHCSLSHPRRIPVPEQGELVADLLIQPHGSGGDPAVNLLVVWACCNTLTG